MMSELMNDGFSLMVFGMGTVFAFLTLLVFSTSLMSRFANAFAGDEKPEIKGITPIPQPSAAVDPQLVKVLSTAVKEYKARQ